MVAEGNPRQQPFACQTFETVLGQPQVDNQSSIGYPVTHPGGDAPSHHGNIDSADIIGYSADCGAPTQINYYYGPTNGGPLKALPDPSSRPGDMATLQIGGQSVNYIVRHEIGTLNRFIYAIYMLTPNPGSDNEPDLSAWNGSLVYNLRGGGGPGFAQSAGSAIKFVQRPDARHENLSFLERGYAVVGSTGTATNTTLNMPLNAQTAKMIKEQFVAAYGEPNYTFGFGISGGATQQLFYAENHPGLLDALIPLDAFGDGIITGLNPVGDCELLEFYFDRVDAAVNGTGVVNPKWKDWENRQLIEGYNARNGAPTLFDDGTGRPIGSSANPGSSECIEGWREANPQVVNPHFVFGEPYELIRQTQPEVYAQTHFSLFEDMKDIFGVDPASGFARFAFDNVGVQYGLKPLVAGQITPEEFLLINAHIGGFKQPFEWVAPGFPFQGSNQPDNVDPWSSRNATAQNHMTPGAVAPRTSADLDALRAAYQSGLVFRGEIDIPMIVVDGYQERQLDQHHSHEKFEIRARMLRTDGDASNLVLWTVDTAAGGHLEALNLAANKALPVLHEWLETGLKPDQAEDACFDVSGSLIARSPHVYSGVLTDDPGDDGVCAQRFPIFGSPRMVAGENITGDTLKCVLKSVDTAFTDGTYGEVSFTEAQRERLKAIFPEGVCDYTQPDQALP